MKQLLPIKLYHGTSTIFLNSIISEGLGGINPVKDWNLVKLSKEVYNLSEHYLSKTDLFLKSGLIFKKMTEQSKDGVFNWQHGDTYLSPSLKTAANYAINKKYGSELLTYTLDFIKELKRLKVSEIEKLIKEYKKIFSLININPSPILIEISDIPINSLLNEKGEDCSDNIAEICELLQLENDMQDLYLRQCNFRLTEPIITENLKFWLINVKVWNPFTPDFDMYRINIDSLN